MHRTRAAGALLGSLILVAGCDGWLTKPSLYNTVTVIVTTRHGEPIPGAALTLYTGQRPMGYATTGPDGQYVFAQVPQGNYGVFAIPPDGYVPIENLLGGPSSIYKDRLIVADDTLSPVRFTYLKKGPGTLVARVTQTDGTAIAGATVTAYTSKAVDGKAITDAAGRATFANLSFGIHGLFLERPLLYRDFRAPGDSLYAYRDNLIVEAGSSDTTSFRLARCAGTVRAIALDGTGAPVRGVTATFYTSTQQLAVLATGTDGTVSYSAIPCAVQVGVQITPAAGYTAPSGRGFRFIDGLTVTNGARVDATFHLVKTS
jgi:hypothetical protein